MPQTYNLRARCRRFVNYMCIGISVLAVSQCCIVAALCGRAERRLPNGAHLGSNGFSIRYVWTPGGGAEIAWDDLPGLPRVTVQSYLVFVEIPMWTVVIASVLVGLTTHFVCRKPRVRRGRSV